MTTSGKRKEKANTTWRFSLKDMFRGHTRATGRRQAADQQVGDDVVGRDDLLAKVVVELVRGLDDVVRKITWPGH